METSPEKVNKILTEEEIASIQLVAKFIESTHIGSSDGIPIGNLAVLEAIRRQKDSSAPEDDVSVAIYKAHN